MGLLVLLKLNYAYEFSDNNHVYILNNLLDFMTCGPSVVQLYLYCTLCLAPKLVSTKSTDPNFIAKSGSYVLFFSSRHTIFPRNFRSDIGENSHENFARFVASSAQEL